MAAAELVYTNIDKILVVVLLYFRSRNSKIPNCLMTSGNVVSTSPTTCENILYIGSKTNSTKLLGDVERGAFLENFLVFSLK